MTQTNAGAFDRQIQEAAARADLGAYRGGYQKGSATSTAAMRVGIAVCGLFGIATVASLATGYPALAIVTGLPTVIGALRLLLGGMASGGPGALHLYQGGVVVLHKNQVRVVRYADSTVLDNTKRHTQYGRTLSTVYSFGLTDTDGRNLVVGSAFPGGEQWGPWVQQDSATAQLPGALARLRAGEKLDFGLLWITAGEIGSGNTSAPWHQVERVEIKDGSIDVRVAGRRGALAASWVRLTPNFSLFHTLTDMAAQGRPLA
ncbi:MULTISPECIES: DUF6585 family protein [Streptomyces]|uniref:DUF6585 family protein n=1 Tax=Streptomyces solicathayae TaxID=3081768 RepID=A0ABZ0LV96_9ACTN|nr:DUF6585 family protein [Streptomyces sp. HUAS YS2]WOX23426.1 DUF6585 family protein [Streptomyces sp. HUAS YS2]